MSDNLSPAAQRLALALAPDWGHLNVNSAYRDPQENRNAGGAYGSQHLQGNAFDVDVSKLTDEQKRAFLEAAIRGGARGIGIYPGGRTIHIDVREKPAIWGPRGYDGSPVSTFPEWAQPALSGLLGGKTQVAAASKPPLPKYPSAPILPPVPEGTQIMAQAKTTKAAAPAGNPDFDWMDKELGQGGGAASDFDWMDKELGNPAKTSPNSMDATRAQRLREIKGKSPGEKGLVWTKDGGVDPRTGELVIAGKPMSPNPYGGAEAVANGVLLGFGPEVTGMIAGMRGKDRAKTEATVRSQAKEFADENPGTALAGEIAGATATTIPAFALGGMGIGAGLGKIAPQVGPKIANFLAGGAGYGSAAASGALQGAAGAVATQKLNPDTPLDKQIMYGAAFGAPGGMLGHWIGGKVAPREIPNRAAGEAAEKLVNAGVPVQGGQLMGRAPSNGVEQLARYTKAVAKTFDGDKVLDALGRSEITPEVLEMMKDNLSQKFEKALNTIQAIPIDKTFVQDLRRVVTQLDGSGLMPHEQDAVKRTIANIMQQGLVNGPNGWMIDARVFQELVKKGSGLEKLRKSPTMGQYAYDVYEALMKVGDRTSSPTFKEFREAKNLYRNYIRLEPALLKAAQTGGFVDPAAIGTKIGKVSKEVDELAQGARLLPRPDEVGQTKPFFSTESLARFLPAGQAGIAGGAAGMGLANFAPSLTNLLTSSPAHVAGAGVGLGVYALNRGIDRAIQARPEYTRRMIQNALTQSAPTNAPAVTTGAVPFGQFGARGQGEDESGPLRITVTPNELR